MDFELVRNHMSSLDKLKKCGLLINWLLFAIKKIVRKILQIIYELWSKVWCLESVSIRNSTPTDKCLNEKSTQKIRNNNIEF